MNERIQRLVTAPIRTARHFSKERGRFKGVALTVGYYGEIVGAGPAAIIFGTAGVGEAAVIISLALVIACAASDAILSCENNIHLPAKL